MRVMVGLTPPTAGRVTIGGHLYHDIPNPGRHVGVLLDASAQHAGRTGREILELGARTMGLPATRIDEMLELVSLTPAEAKRRLRNYSLGMKQRLGIAHALLGDRSEEHTSELQSLMRNSYAVFCLKKKKKNQNQP